MIDHALLQLGYKPDAVQNLNAGLPRKIRCIRRHASRCHQEATSSALVGHAPDQFTDDAYAHLPCLPVLALNQIRLATPPNRQIHASIRAGATPLGDREPTSTKMFADKTLEIPPR